MITKEIALTLKHGDILYHVLDKNVDGTPRRCRVSGKVKTWKKKIGRASCRERVCQYV